MKSATAPLLLSLVLSLAGNTGCILDSLPIPSTGSSPDASSPISTAGVGPSSISTGQLQLSEAQVQGAFQAVTSSLLSQQNSPNARSKPKLTIRDSLITIADAGSAKQGQAELIPLVTDSASAPASFPVPAGAPTSGALP
jgi:hypothetical protein